MKTWIDTPTTVYTNDVVELHKRIMELEKELIEARRLAQKFEDALKVVIATAKRRGTTLGG